MDTDINDTKPADAAVYSETPGTDQNNGMHGEISKPDAATTKEAMEKLAADKKEERKETIEKNDTSGTAS